MTTITETHGERLEPYEDGVHHIVGVVDLIDWFDGTTYWRSRNDQIIRMPHVEYRFAVGDTVTWGFFPAQSGRLFMSANNGPYIPIPELPLIQWQHWQEKWQRIEQPQHQSETRERES